MNFTETEVFNFRGALRGMRNPLNSWYKSDSYEINNKFIIGSNDLKLVQGLIPGGAEHRKFLRQIMVSVDITAPLYIWKELDTYKIGTTANSTSTMHKLASTPITLDCFEIGDYNPIIEEDDYSIRVYSEGVLIPFLESLRLKYLETKNKKYWKELIRWLPESWLQKRTITLNYEVLRNIVHQRAHHKLIEWTAFIDWCKTLPYAEELIFYKN